MKKNSIILLFIVTFIFNAGIVKAENLDFHKPTPCFGCHLEGIYADYGSVECGNCHDYYLDVERLESGHNPKICTACHMGNTLINASTKEIFHNGHEAVNCTTCHTEDNFTVIKMRNTGFECVSCHSTKVHSIHIKNLDKACPICHGSWAKGKVYIPNTPSSNTSQEILKFEKFTIFYIIKTLFNTLFGVK